jgi:hypothetical protein
MESKLVEAPWGFDESSDVMAVGRVCCLVRQSLTYSTEIKGVRRGPVDADVQRRRRGDVQAHSELAPSLLVPGGQNPFAVHCLRRLQGDSDHLRREGLRRNHHRPRANDEPALRLREPGRGAGVRPAARASHQYDVALVRAALGRTAGRDITRCSAHCRVARRRSSRVARPEPAGSPSVRMTHTQIPNAGKLAEHRENHPGSVSRPIGWPSGRERGRLWRNECRVGISRACGIDRSRSGHPRRSP